MAVWVQGCPLRCPGCCNPEMLGTNGGDERSVTSLLDELDREQQDAGGAIEGVTLLGGEPFAQASALAAFAVGVAERGLTVMAFSGFKLSELRAKSDDSINDLLAVCDLLVDGPFRRREPDHVRRWIGSRNQVMHFLSDRYEPSDPRFVGDETFEIRYADGVLTVNGWPAPADQVVRLIGRGRARV